MQSVTYSNRKRSSGGALPRSLYRSAKSTRASRAVTSARRYVATSSRYNRSVRGLNRRGVSSPDTGYVDVANTAYNFDLTGSIVLLNTIAQGASVNQRVGKKCVLKSIAMRGAAVNNAAALYNDCALLIVYDRRPTGSLPAITDILVSAASVSFNNDTNSGRFSILKRADFMLVGAPSITTGTEMSACSADFFLSLKGLPVVAKAAGTGAIGDIEEGALYLITVGNAAAGTSAATLNAGFRVRFMDV